MFYSSTIQLHIYIIQLYNLTSWWWNLFLVFFHLTSLSFFELEVKSITSVILRDIGRKQIWPIRLQNLKSNISLEENDEIVYFFSMLIQEKNVCGQKWLWPPWSQDELMNWAEFLHFHANSEKLRMTFLIFGWLWSQIGMGL